MYGDSYTLHEDRFLFHLTAKYGYGNWNRVKTGMRVHVWCVSMYVCECICVCACVVWCAGIRVDDEFRFDYWLKSRTGADLGRRIDSLLRLLAKNTGTHATSASCERAAHSCTSRRERQQSCMHAYESCFRVSCVW